MGENEGQKKEEEAEEEDIICLDASFFLDENYVLKEFEFGKRSLSIFTLDTSSTDFDLTGQIVWPGAILMNEFISVNPEEFSGRTVLELGSGLGLTGIFCADFAIRVVLTDHSPIVLKATQRNIDFRQNQDPSCAAMACDLLQWGDTNGCDRILNSRSGDGGFDVILGADVCYQEANIGPLFATAKHFMVDRSARGGRAPIFFLAHVERNLRQTSAVKDAARKQSMDIVEVEDSRKLFSGGYGGSVYRITMKTT